MANRSKVERASRSMRASLSPRRRGRAPSGRVGGVRHDLEGPLPADLEGSADLVVEQERMGVEVPCRPHDAAREVKLDRVDAVLDLLADGFHPTIGAVNLQRMTRGQERSARGGEEITAGEQPRASALCY